MRPTYRLICFGIQGFGFGPEDSFPGLLFWTVGALFLVGSFLSSPLSCVLACSIRGPRCLRVAWFPSPCVVGVDLGVILVASSSPFVVQIGDEGSEGGKGINLLYAYPLFDSSGFSIIGLMRWQ